MPPSNLQEYYELSEKNKMLMRIFGFKGEGITEEWGKNV
jgi:hypothetical protein